MTARFKLLKVFFLYIILGFIMLFSVYADSVRSEHPRILLTDQVLAVLGQKVINNAPEWQELKSKADAYLTGVISSGYYGGVYSEAIRHLGLVYKLTGNTVYSDKVIEVMQTMVDTVDVSVIKGDSGYGIRNYGPAMAIGYDWCYEQLSEDLKTGAYQRLNEWLDWYANGTPEYPTPGYQNNGPALGNYFSGYFLALGLTGYATYGDNSQAQEHIDNARGFFENLIREAADNGEMRGGDDPEGEYAFGYYPRIFYYLLTVKSATGEDIVSDGFNWPREVVYSHIHRTKPQIDKCYDWGDWSYAGTVYATPMLILSHILNGTTEGRYAKYYAEHVGGTSAFDRMLFYHVDAQAEMWNNEPLSYFSIGSSLITTRSSWDSNATWASFQGETGVFVGHQDYDCGHFSIQRGSDYLVVDSDQGYGGHMYNTNHNSILVDDNGEVLTYPPFQSSWGDMYQVEAFEDGNDYVYVKSNITTAYNGPTWYPDPTSNNPLSNFRRHFLYIRPDYFVIFDRVTTKKDYYMPIWVLHPATQPTISGDVVSAVVGNSKIFSKTLLPENHTIEYVAESSSFGHRIDVKPGQASLDNLFLHVLHAASSTSSMPFTQRIDGTTIVGVQGLDWISMFSRTETTLEVGQFNISGSGTYRTIIADSIPNAYYDVFVDGSLHGTHTATGSGLLVFDLPLNGQHTVIISSGTADYTAPAAITNLGASTGTEVGSIKLTWTATGDDGNVGTAASYIIRHSTSAITAANWGSAADVTGEPLPKPAGASETFTVTGLTPGQTYYFAIKAQDEAGNISDISNSPSAPAAGDITPPEISGVASSDITDTTATVSWTTDEPADSVVEYGTTTGYGNTSSDATLETDHNRTLTGLSPDTTYHYRVSSTDSDGNTATSGDFTFTTQPSGYDKIFSDIPDFGNADNWTPLTPGYWEVSVDPVSDDRAYFLNDTARSDFDYTLFNLATYGSFTMTLRARTADPPSNAWRDYLVIFGYQDPENYYYVFFNASDDDETNGIIKRENGVITEISELGLPPTIVDGLYHDIEISRIGANITVRMDGVTKYTATDSTFGTGKIGLGAFNDSAYFDDVNVIPVDTPGQPGKPIHVDL